MRRDRWVQRHRRFGGWLRELLPVPEDSVQIEAVSSGIVVPALRTTNQLPKHKWAISQGNQAALSGAAIVLHAIFACDAISGNPIELDRRRFPEADRGDYASLAILRMELNGCPVIFNGKAA